MVRFIIITFGIFFAMSLLFGARTIYSIMRFLFRGSRNQQGRNQQQKTEKPVSQDERIITYKKKEFEISPAEDVDFEEIKNKEE